ncbi:MAG TPA: hypothetical protein EYN79_02240 [Planctomycetes bacterium]|nr:hypothetical protein [Planctomycetota bacterium]HIN80595.1 hypothetical protein [Planctomycetota bacterium]
MKTRRWFATPLLLISLFSLLLPGRGLADVIVYNDGRRLEGKILETTEKRILMEVVLGGVSAELWVSRKDISRIEKGATPQEEFAKRLEALDNADLEGHRVLIAWCREKGLSTEAKLLSARLPAVEIAARKVTHPARWCRGCDALGMALCEKCQGKGEIGEECARCSGSGAALCKTCVGKEGSLLSCRRCAGTGSYEKFDPRRGRKVKVSCNDCRGKGKIICPTCGGKKSRSCTHCSGKGSLALPCDGCLGKKRLPCERCSGTGLQEKPLSAEELAREKLEKEKAAKEGEGAKEVEKKGEEKKKKPVIKIDPFG